MIQIMAPLLSPHTPFVSVPKPRNHLCLFSLHLNFELCWLYVQILSGILPLSPLSPYSPVHHDLPSGRDNPLLPCSTSKQEHHTLLLRMVAGSHLLSPGSSDSLSHSPHFLMSLNLSGLLPPQSHHTCFSLCLTHRPGSHSLTHIRCQFI